MTDRACVAVLIGIIAVLAGGCDPCWESCADEARALDSCMTEWELAWVDFDAEDELDYRRRCRDEAFEEYRSASDEELALRNPLCVGRSRALRNALSCEEKQEALFELGAP